MEPPVVPVDEEDRLQGLYKTKLLDTACEPRFDRYTRLAARLLNVRRALVTLVDRDRQWFKSRYGLSVSETPRDVSFCGHTILTRNPLIVPDARDDYRFVGNPLVVGDPHVIFYAGAPIYDRRGRPIGTFCLIDDHPRQLNQDEIRSLTTLAKLVTAEVSGHLGTLTDHLSTISSPGGLVHLSDYALSVAKLSNQHCTVWTVEFNPKEHTRSAEQILHELLPTAALIGRLGPNSYAAIQLTSAHPFINTDVIKEQKISEEYGLKISHTQLDNNQTFTQWYDEHMNIRQAA